jgi:hypothetical protein
MLSSKKIRPTSSNSKPIHILAGEDPSLSAAPILSSAKPTSIPTTTSIQAAASDTQSQLPHSVHSWLSEVVDRTFSGHPLPVEVPSKRSLTPHKSKSKRRRIQAKSSPYSGVSSEAEAASVCSCNGSQENTQHPPTDEESDRESEPHVSPTTSAPSVTHVSDSAPDLDSGVGEKPTRFMYDIARAGHKTPPPKIPTSLAWRHQRARTV